MKLENQSSPSATPLLAKSPRKRTLTAQSITIKKSRHEVFNFFRNFENLPYFMKDLTAIEVLSPTRSKWTVTLKSGQSTSWIAEITHEEPGEMISWKSLDGSDVETSGLVNFGDAANNRGTTVELVMNYRIPGGKFIEFVTRLSGEDPETLGLINLKRLKALLETGEVATIEGQTSGRDQPVVH